MSLPTAALRKLAEFGLTMEQILEVSALTDEPKDAAAERRRAYDRERKAKLPTNWLEVREFVLERDGAVCTYCGDVDGPFHIDHVDPLARGGASDPDNLCVACRDCNLAKSDMPAEEWRALCQ